MAKINLLPWRAERRERRKREFFSQLIIAAVAAIVLVLLWGFWMSIRINNQNDRNEYLTGQIKQLDAKISEIKDLQKTKDRLLARKKIIEKLQSSRSQMVHLFDEIVKTIPPSVRLTALTQKSDKLTLDGVAQSNDAVAVYMRRVEASPWMGPARLVGTENVHTDSNMPYEFEFVVTLGTPKADGADGTPASGSSVAAAAPAGASMLAPLPASTAATTVPPASPTTAPTRPAVIPHAAATAPAAVPAPMPAPATTGDKAPAAPAAKGGARP